jgi:Uma2 family endonuclease
MNPLLIEKIKDHPDLISLDTEQQYTLTGVSWQTYEALLTDLGDDFSGIRIHYLEGTLEITRPGRQNEVAKDNIARLLGVYFEETRTRFYGLGSTTFKSEAKLRGAEPDTSFCIATDKDLPDIAIEVVNTSGGVNKLEIYRGLGVPEVWFWQAGKFTLFHLRESGYEPIQSSEFLPNLDLALLATYVQNLEPLDAVIDFRAALRETLS